MARFLEGDAVELTEGSDPRQALLDWLRRDADQYFARALVNRVWAGYFHVGIVEPADDLNRANPPSNQALLDWLTRGFVERQFDMKWLHREIANSRTYQLSCRPNDSNHADTRNFSWALPRRLPAEVAYNALLQATARTDQLAMFHTDVGELATGNSSGPPNAKGRGRNNYALAIFGRPLRATNCDCERSMEPTLLQTLFLRNDGEMLGLIERPDGWLTQLGGEAKTRVLVEQVAELTGRKQKRASDLEELEAKDLKELAKRRQKVEGEIAQIDKQLAKVTPLAQAPPTEPLDTATMIRQSYLRTVSRPPTDAEIARIAQYISEPDNQQSALRDVLWALLNTKEFILNH